jgi:hypothetical protein
MARPARLAPWLLALATASLALAADDAGFVALFDGKTLDGWTPVGGKSGNWTVSEEILITKGEGGGWLSTEKTYDNFVLALEYRLQKGGNSGVFIRSPRSGDPAYTGMEIQILDDDADVYKNLKPFQYCGSVYGVSPSTRGHTKPAGQWNAMEIRAEGSKITVKLNGETVVETNLDDHADDAKTHPGIKRTEGYIGLQSHSEPVEFRNVRIKTLK